MNRKMTVTGKQPAGRIKAQTDFSKISIRDDVMFCSVFRNPEDCRELLQRITGIQIDQIRSGQMYTQLQESIVIFVCEFDLFAQNKSIYTFEKVCRGEKDIVLDDKQKTIFVNINGDRSEIEKDAADLLDYFKTGRPTDAFTRGLQGEVEKIRQDTEWRESYMTYEMKIELESQIRAEKLAQELAKELAKEQAKELAQELAQELAKEQAKELAKEQAKELAEELARQRIEEAAEKATEKGMAEGWTEGEKARDRELATRWFKKGRTVREIAEDLDREEAYVQKLIEKN